MSIITNSNLPAPIQESFSNKMLSVPTPYMIHKIPADLKMMPANGGRTLRMRRSNPLPTSTVPLGDSGIDPGPTSYSAVNIDATMSFYGQYILVNEQVTLTHQDPVLNEMAERLGVALRQTEDELTRNMLQATASFINATGGTNADNPTELTRADIDGVVQVLRGNNAYSFMSGIQGENRFGTAPVRDAYFALGHTDLTSQMESITGFQNKWTYPNQQSTLEAEIGAVANVRFLLSSIGSVSKNSSLNSADVYNIFVVGRESYCCIDQDKYSAQFIYRDPIHSGPLAMNASLGYKFAEVPVITNDAWVVDLRCTAA